MENDKNQIAGIAKAMLTTSDTSEIARLNIIIDVQQRQIRQLISEKSKLLQELNAIYRAGSTK